MQRIIVSFLILLALVGAIWFYKGQLNGKNPFLPRTTAVVNNHTINLLIAESPKELETGLSSKDSLPKDQGMIFLFSQADYYPFWMKQMKFAIDIIYIQGNKVVTVFANVPPPQNSSDTNLILYKPEERADKVLEINAGQSQQFDIKNGDTIEFKNL